MKTILLWDARLPAMRPVRLTVADELASAAVRAGVAAAANPADHASLAAGGALDGGSPMEVVLQHGALGLTRRVMLPASVAAVGAQLGIVAAVGTAVGGYTPAPAPTPAAFWGATMTGTDDPKDTLGSQFPGFMSFTPHAASEETTSLKVVVGNWIANESRNNGDATEKVSIEYPLGSTPQVFLFGGAKTVTLANGGEAESDALTLATPIPKGGLARIRRFRQASVGPIYNKGYSLPAGYGGRFTNAVDQTESGTPNVEYGDSFLSPLALLTQTTKRPVHVIGDSRAYGTSGGSPSATDATIGNITPSLSFNVPHLKTSLFGEFAETYAGTGAAKRLGLSRYAKDAIIELGINDVTNRNRTAAQLKAYIETIIGKVKAINPDARIWLTTLEPLTASTDGWITTANQTPKNNAVRVEHNNAVRAKNFVGQYGFFEIADAVENSRDDGLIKVLTGGVRITTDGAHWLPNGNALIVSSGAIPVSAFTA